MKKKASGPKPNRKSWVIQQLRRISMRWPPRNRVYKANRRELPRKIKKDGTPFAKPNFEHQCNNCENWFMAKDITMDHVQPVVDLEGMTDLPEAEYIGRFAIHLLCYEENWQKLCNKCHDAKTLEEDKIRDENNKK